MLAIKDCNDFGGFTMVKTKMSLDVRDMGVKVDSSKPHLQNNSVFFNSVL